MFSNRLPGDRFFAHLRAFDTECPRCGLVYTFSQAYVKHGVSSAWDHSTNRFRCHGCRLVLGLGILAWPLGRGRLLRAEDSVPTTSQARELKRQHAALRRMAQGFELDRTDPAIHAIAGRLPRNIVLTEECPCDPESPYAHPSCPIHGHGGGQ